MGKMEQSVKEQSEGQIAEIEKLRTDLQKMRDEFDKYRSDEAAYHAAAELREKHAKKREVWIGIISSVAGGSIAGLFIYYWPSIVSAVGCLFHG